MFQIAFGHEIEVRFNTDFTKSESNELYTGAYTVTPKREKQVLPTANKLMAEDVTVKEIPYSVTSNTAGGTTFYIGKKVN